MTTTWVERFKARTHGEVSRDGLDPYQAAGRQVYEYILDLDQLRAQDSSTPGVQAALLAGWVAFALQVMGDEMLAADAALDPSTAHYVPPVTAQQVSVFYEPVQAWMGRAAAAKVNPSYTLTVPLPVLLPRWVASMPCPPAHLLAVRQAVTRLRDYTEALLPGFEPGPRRSHARDIVDEGIAAAGAAADYAHQMWGADSAPPPAGAHAPIEANLKNAAESYFYLGQVIAMPSLADTPRRQRPTELDEDGRPPIYEHRTRAFRQDDQRQQGHPDC